jgi:hypothetical protein
VLSPEELAELIGEIQELPDDSVLNERQKAALRENVERFVSKSLPAKVASGKLDSVQRFLREDRRWRFLSQVPEARARLAAALDGTGIELP